MGSSNIEGISLTIRGGVPVTGRVRVEGETTESLAQVHVMLQPAEAGGIIFGPMPTQQVKEDGSFQLDDVGADRYTVSVNGLPEGFYVKSVRSANLDVLADGLEVAGGSPAPLDVVLSPKAAQVSGTVLDPKTQKAAAAMTVVLVPQEKERRDREPFYRTATTRCLRAVHVQERAAGRISRLRLGRGGVRRVDGPGLSEAAGEPGRSGEPSGGRAAGRSGEPDSGRLAISGIRRGV